MEFRRTAAGEPPPPSLHYQPPQQQPPQPSPQPPTTGYSCFTEQVTGASYRNARFGLGNSYFSQGIGRNMEWFGRGIGRANENFQTLNSYREEIQRQLELERIWEKERIREEIIAEEIARRRVLEAEVRAELRMEREWAMRNRGGSTFDRFSSPVETTKALEPRGISFSQEAKGLSLEEKNAAVCAEERLRMLKDMMPFQGKTNVESKVEEAPPSHLESDKQKEKIVFLVKPSGSVPGTKRKAAFSSEESVEELVSGGNIKRNEDWCCLICQVTATSESSLNDHLKGKKHKFKEAALEEGRKGCIIGVGVVPKNKVKPGVEMADVWNPKTEGLKLGGEELEIGQSEASLLDIVPAKDLDADSVPMLPKTKKKNQPKKKKLVGVQKTGKKRVREKKDFAFWCEMCQAGAHSLVVMEGHRKGKKHWRMLKKVKENGSAILNIEAAKGDDKEHVENKDVSGNKEEKEEDGGAAKEAVGTL